LTSKSKLGMTPSGEEGTVRRIARTLVDGDSRYREGDEVTTAKSKAKTVTVRKRISATEAHREMDRGVRARFGKWIWVLLLGADAAYEILAFIDSADGYPTLSELVKRAERAGGIVASIAVGVGLVLTCVVLILHWVVQAF
jgi:hypothetical protein